MDSGATFSQCRKYRYVLCRIWDNDKPKVMFIGLNPSKANEIKPDPTITRIKKFTEDWGYGGFYMLNLFAFVTPYPKELMKCEDPLNNNDEYLEHYGTKKADLIIFAWGNFKAARKRSEKVIRMFPVSYALILNKNGTPRHPLYVKGDVKPIIFNL